MELLNLEEFNEEYLNLCESTQSALKELKDLTGKDVVFRMIDQSEAIGYFKLKIKLARNFMEEHIIVINTDRVTDKNELNYWIVHEIMHGLRTFNANPSDRKILSSDDARSSEILENIISTMDKELLSALDMNTLRAYCNNLLLNTNLVLFNSSVDARIELGIYEKYPELRNLQKKVQKEYLKELLAGFVNKDVRKHTPSWILDRVNLMNYCYMKKITSIIGKA